MTILMAKIVKNGMRVIGIYSALQHNSKNIKSVSMLFEGDDISCRSGRGPI